MEEIYEEVAKELNLPVDTVTKVYRYHWKFIKETIESLPLKDNLTKEEFEKLRTNFNLPGIGKLYITWEDYKKTIDKYNGRVKD